MSLISSAPYSILTVAENHERRTTTRHVIPTPKKLTRSSLPSFSSTIVTPLTELVTSSTRNNKPGDVAMQTDGPTKDRSTVSEYLKKKPKEGFWVSNWDWVYETNLFWFVGVHVLAACAPFAFDWNAVWVMVTMAFFNGFGITLGYHRLLTHQGFHLPKWLEYFFAYCGSHALQRDPIVWVSTHKLHHKHADTEMDPHSPTQGVWFSHIGWFLYNDYVATKCGESKGEKYPNVSELKAQRFYRFLHDTYFWHPSALAALLYLCGGFPCLAWGMGMRITVLHLVTYIESRVNHLWGERPWNTPDASTNNWWVAMMCLGEGWHNNHHAFPKSARHGLEWWQLDVTWELIRFLQAIGLATNVKLPTEAQKARMAILSSNGKHIINNL